MNIRLIPTCTVLIASCVIACAAQPSKPGGWATAAVTKKEVVDAAAFAIKAEGKALQDPKAPQPAKLVLVKILEAEEQVVAGMNYRLKLKVKLNGEEKTAEAVVWWQAWRTPDPYQLTSWKWSERKAEPSGSAGGSQTPKKSDSAPADGAP
jgi:hypothetical protein